MRIRIIRRLSRMQEVFNSISAMTFFGVALTLVCYNVGIMAKKKLKIALFSPILVAIVLVIAILKLTGIEYETYKQGTTIISYLLTPATVCLAVPLYEKLKLLRENLWAVLGGIISGIMCSVLTVWGVCVVFSLDKTIFATLLPKSITTAIGMVVSEQQGGIVTITVASIVITGIFGNMVAETIYKIFKIDEPIAKGIALGTSAHVMGTSKALEIGDIEGAMSGLAVAVAGLITVLVAPLLMSMV